MILDGPVVVLDGQVCRHFDAVLVAALADARRQGRRVPAAVAEAVSQVQAVAGHHRGEALPDTAASAVEHGVVGHGVGHDDYLDTEGAAAVIGCSPRGVRWLAQHHGLGRKVRNRWIFDPEDLAAYLERTGA